MENITTGSIKIMSEKVEKIKFLSILKNFAKGVKPSITEDKFVDEQISKLNLLKIDTDYVIKFE